VLDPRHLLCGATLRPRPGSRTPNGGARAQPALHHVGLSRQLPVTARQLTAVLPRADAGAAHWKLIASSLGS